MYNQRDEIKEKIEKIASGRGLEVVELTVFSSCRRPVVRCLVDYPQGGVTIDECVALNKIIFSYLEESGSLGQNFSVEVSSPGIDRKLKTYKDFLRVKGKPVCLWFQSPWEGKQYWEGELKDLDEKSLSVEIQGKVWDISLEQIKVGKEKI